MLSDQYNSTVGLETLHKYGLECSHITHISNNLSTAYTCAYALSIRPHKNQLVLVDSNKPDGLDKFNNHCRYEAVNTVFYHMDGLQCPNERTDMVFIGKTNTENLKQYLERWGKVTNKYIIIETTDRESGQHPSWKIEHQSHLLVLKKLKSIKQ